MIKQIFNPYLPPWEYLPDGEPRVFDQRLYIFGSHDNAKGNDYCLNDYVSWSAPLSDLSDWRYEGIIYRKDQDPMNKKNEPMYAPDVAQGSDGRFYLYYSVKNTSVMSVAVCDSPTGQYEYLGAVKKKDGHILGTRKEDWFQFDPSVLVDDDGRIFLYSGSGQNFNKKWGFPVVGCFVMELEQDMLTLKSEPKILMPADEKWNKPNFFEGASVRHIGEYYYLVFPATNVSGLNYAISKYPDKDFVYQGSIHSTSDIGYEGRKIMQARYPIGNNHGGLVKLNGQWYIFDHRMTNQTAFQRQGVAEPVTIRPDGSIDMVEATSCGLNGAPLEGKGVYPAYIACNLMGKSFLGMRNPMKCPYVTQDGEDYNPACESKGELANGGVNGNPPQVFITNVKNGYVAGYKYFDLKNPSQIRIKVKGEAVGRFSVSCTEKGNTVASFDIHRSIDWEEYQTNIKTVQSVSALYFKFAGSGSLDFLEFEIV